MRIAQIAPLFESVPPHLYGGTERIVFNLTEALIASGHDVTLFASRDSDTSAPLISVDHDALRLSHCDDPIIPHLLLFEKVRKLKDEFDVLHFHTEYLHFPFARTLRVPNVSTLHGRMDLSEYPPLFSEFSELPMVSISSNQRTPLPDANWVGTVHHGLDSSLLKFHPQSNGYLAFLGRLSPEKGFQHAVEIARRTGSKLRVAAKVQPEQYPDYWKKIEPLLNEPFVEFIGEIGDDRKSDFLGGADALLFPIEWPEPFGLVMIESLAVGTPVIAFRCGAVPEIIRSGKTGFIVDTVEQACEAVKSLPLLKRIDCLTDFRLRFTRERMAAEYLTIYQHLCMQTSGVRRTERRMAHDAGRSH